MPPIKFPVRISNESAFLFPPPRFSNSFTSHSFSISHRAVPRAPLTLPEIQETHHPHPPSIHASVQQPEGESFQTLTSSLPSPIQKIFPASQSSDFLIILAEAALQLTVVFLAVSVSLQARRRLFAVIFASLSIPQLFSTAVRVLAQMPSQHAPSPNTLHRQTPTESSLLSAPNDRTVPLSKILTTCIRSAITDEIDAMRSDMEHKEQVALKNENKRNASIAQAIAALDSNIRSLRRTVDATNQARDAEPFPLVSELELVNARLRQSQQDNLELEVRLRAAESNFEEAKRLGDRFRREANEAKSEHLSLRTELAVAQTRLQHLDDVKERLATADARNEELQHMVISRAQEQERWKQSAEDAEKRASHVENVSGTLRKKLQDITAKFSVFYPEKDGEQPERSQEELDEQYLHQRLRSGGDLGPNSVVYQEVLRGRRGLAAKVWPGDPLGTNKMAAPLKSRADGLPAGGGFGGANTPSSNLGGSQNADEKVPQLPSSAVGKMFSFSRGEFDTSDTTGSSQFDSERIEQREGTEIPDMEYRKVPGFSNALTNDPSLETVEEQSVDNEGDEEGIVVGNYDSNFIGEKDKQIDEASVYTNVKESEGEMREKDVSVVATDVGISIEKKEKNDGVVATDGVMSIENKEQELRGVATDDKMSVEKREEEERDSSSSGEISRKENVALDVSRKVSITDEGEEGENDVGGDNIYTNKEEEEESVMEANGKMVDTEVEEDNGTKNTSDRISVGKNEGEEEISMDNSGDKSTDMKEDEKEVKTSTTSEIHDVVGLEKDNILLRGMNDIRIPSTKDVGELNADQDTNPVAHIHAQHELKDVEKNEVMEHGNFSQTLDDQAIESQGNSVRGHEEKSRHILDEESAGSGSHYSLSSKAHEKGPSELHDNVDIPELVVSIPTSSVQALPGRKVGAAVRKVSEETPSVTEDTNQKDFPGEANTLSSQTSTVLNGQDVCESELVIQETQREVHIKRSYEDSTVDNISEHNKANTIEKEFEDYSTKELVESAGELVKKARRRGLAIVHADVLFRRALQKLEIALERNEEISLVEAEFGGCLLAWAKVNLADAEAYERLSRALGYLTASLKSEPENEITLFNCGLCLCLLASMSDSEQARVYYVQACELYDKLTEINKDSRIGNFNCGLSYISLGRLGLVSGEKKEKTVEYFEKAANRFQRSLDLKPEDSKAMSYLEDCQRHLAGVDR